MNIGFGKSKKEVTLLLILAILVVVAAYFNILIRPTMEGLFHILPKVAMLKSELTDTMALISNKDRIEKENEALERKIEGYKKIFTDEEEIPRFLESLSIIAAESGVKIKAIKPLRSTDKSSVREGGIYEEIPIEISAKSGYHQLGVFLQNLESGEKFLIISAIEIKADQKNIKMHDVRLIASTFAITEKGRQ